MSELTAVEYEQDCKPLPPMAQNIRARHDKLLRDLDMQERVLRELLDELRELNRSSV